jgi:transposase
MTYSMDLRERVVAAVEAGEAIAVIARLFDVARPTVRDWRDRARRGVLTAGVPGPKGPTKLTEADDRLMREQVAARPGVTAMQLIPLLSVEVAECTVCRRLKKLGLRLKKSR